MQDHLDEHGVEDPVESGPKSADVAHGYLRGVRSTTRGHIRVDPGEYDHPDPDEHPHREPQSRVSALMEYAVTVPLVVIGVHSPQRKHHRGHRDDQEVEEVRK